MIRAHYAESLRRSTQLQTAPESYFPGCRLAAAGGPRTNPRLRGARGHDGTGSRSTARWRFTGMC